jgi:hypothetical protein
MPVFPSFMRRMQQEMSRAATLGQGGPPPPLEPFRINRPETPNLFETQNETPPIKSSADKIRETVASQLRYEDVAPKLEPIPEPPAFKPKGRYGIVDRLKMALGGAGLGSQRGGGLGALGGIIAGLVNPEAVDRHGYAAYVRPQYDAEAQAAMGRNKARMGNFEGEMKAREIISKINQANAPEWAQATGAAQTMFYDKKSGRFKFGTDEQGEPVEAASVVAARTGARSREHVASQNRIAAEKKLAQEIAARIELAERQHGYRMTEIEKRGVIQKAIQRMRDAGATGRLRLKLGAEGYDLPGEGGSAGAGTGPARPGGGTETGAGSAQPSASFLEGLRRQLGLEPEDYEEEDDLWP